MPTRPDQARPISDKRLAELEAICNYFAKNGMVLRPATYYDNVPGLIARLRRAENQLKAVNRSKTKPIETQKLLFDAE